ncbi:sodium/glutamate symporter [Pontiella sp.]|uniref:sodium/glutamate symporter n=1 Tax=Pontiella sp. TaxID=2837462 RepID=UPI003564C63F
MLSFGCLCVLLGLGYWIRRKLVLLQKLYLPASVIAGLVGLAVLQSGRIPAAVTQGWGQLPGQLINIVFACLFLGTALPPVSRVWKSSSRQLAYGQIVAWGQYAVGCFLVLLLMKPLWGLPDIFAGIMPVGFEGGHGTAGGMGPTFDELGFPEMKDYALAAATGGILGAIIVGMGLVNWAVRKGYVEKKSRPGVHADDYSGLIPHEHRPPAGKVTVSSDVIGSLSLHLVFVGAAILLGWLMKEGLILATRGLPDTGREIFRSFPLFPLCMLGGVVVQLLADKLDPHEHMDEGVMLRIQNAALDFLVVAAIATIRIDVVAQQWLPIILLILAGILWNVLMLTVFARRAFKDAWFERGIAEMGQSMGVTATGLLLLRVVDPDYETEAAEAFAAKQLLHEPFMGGGLWTGAAIPLLALWGGWPIFGIAVAAIAGWTAVLFVLNRKTAN